MEKAPLPALCCEKSRISRSDLGSLGAAHVGLGVTEAGTKGREAEFWSDRENSQANESSLKTLGSFAKFGVRASLSP